MNWAAFVFAVLVFPVLSFAAERFVWLPLARWRGKQSYNWKQEALRIWRFCALFNVVWQAIDRQWSSAAGYAVSAVIVIAILWWRRKKRRKATQLLGAKTKALRDALVRKAREVSVPRPVLVPNI